MDKDQLISQMKVLLASTFSLYLKTHNYHWNVTGPNFAQYHEFFGELYNEIWESLDTTAEEIRKLDSYAPGSLSRYLDISRVEDEVNIPEPSMMFKRLSEDNAKVIEQLYTVRDTADNIEQFGVVNYIEERISVHEKHAWMLRSFT